MMDTEDSYDLTILPVKQDHFGINIRRPVHENLPDIQKGANTLIVSSVRSGKSNLLVNLLLNSNFYKDAFDDVYIFSSTIHQDQTSRKLEEAFPATTYDSFDENKLLRILEHQQSYDDPEDRPAIALILDDLPPLKANSLFFQIASRYRHYGIGLLLYSVQNFKMVSPIVRNNATNLILGTLNSAQVAQIGETFQDNIGDKEIFKKLHRQAVPERFNFLHAHLDRYPAEVFQNFDRLIYKADF